MKFRVDDLREVVWCVVGVEEISAKMKECDCLKKKVISMNQRKLQSAWEISCYRRVRRLNQKLTREFWGWIKEESLLRSPRRQTWWRPWEWVTKKKLYTTTIRYRWLAAINLPLPASRHTTDHERAENGSQPWTTISSPVRTVYNM